MIQIIVPPPPPPPPPPAVQCPSTIDFVEVTQENKNIAINHNYELIEDYLNNKVLYIVDKKLEPNQMETDISIDSGNISNLPFATNSEEPVTVSQFRSFLNTRVKRDIEVQEGSDISGGVSTLVEVSYVPGNRSLAVYVDGLRMALGRDFTETSSVEITWINTPSTGSVIEFIYTYI